MTLFINEVRVFFFGWMRHFTTFYIDITFLHTHIFFDLVWCSLLLLLLKKFFSQFPCTHGQQTWEWPTEPRQMWAKRVNFTLGNSSTFTKKNTLCVLIYACACILLSEEFEKVKKKISCCSSQTRVFPPPRLTLLWRSFQHTKNFGRFQKEQHFTHISFLFSAPKI